MCIDLNFEYWVITPTDNWNTLDFQKTWLDCKYPKNKGLAIKALKEQLYWYKSNSFDKEKAKAQELLEELSNDLKTGGRLYKFWNDYYLSRNDYDVSCTEESNINYDGMNCKENEIMYSDCTELKKTITTLRKENEFMYLDYIELKKTITTLESENREYARANIVLADLLNDIIKEKKYFMDRISTLEKELVFALSRNCNK